MLKKLALIFLILTLPIQAWAVSDMPFKHPSAVVVVETQKSFHSCHQDLNISATDNSAPQNQPQDSACNSCVLCMAFAPYSYQFLASQISYSLTSNVGNISFVSYDTPALSKPPIL
jgi:hypothetical protein